MWKTIIKLIDKVKTVEVNEKQIESYLDSIYAQLEGVDREELIRRFVSIEFNQFLSYYENSQDLNGDDSKERRRSSDENFTRFYINLGKMDELNPARLIGLINENISERNVEIGQIEILKNFSFFEIDKKVADEVLKAFANVEFEGRGVIVEITTKPKSRSRGNDRKRSGGGFGGGRRSSSSRDGGSRDGGRSKRSSYSGSGSGGNRSQSGGRRTRNK